MLNPQLLIAVRLEKLQSSYLLVTHGSRDPRPQAALEKLARSLRERLAILVPACSKVGESKPSTLPLVGTSLLEFGPTFLDEQIRQFGEQTLSAGLTRVQLLPLFLLPGVHVKEDIPEAVGSAQRSLGPKLTLDLRPHLGTHPGLTDLIANRMAIPVDTWILLAHGSRRRGGNQTVEEISSQLSAIPAYWSVPPSLETRVAELAAAGCDQIGILPYFLFAGSTTDAIAQEVARLSEEFPQVKVHLVTSLEPCAELVDLILNLIQPADLGSACSR